MTLSEFITYVRNRHNAIGDTNFSDPEILGMLSARSNMALTVIGLLEAVDTSQTTVVGQQAYSFPTDAVAVKQVEYNGNPLQEITFKDWQVEKNGGTTPQGLPKFYVIWNRQVYFIPIPDTASITIAMYYEKTQPLLTATSDSFLMPEVLHYALADGVIADMYAKDLNQNMSMVYEQKWNQIHMPAFLLYRNRLRNRGRFKVMTDPDSHLGTDYGVN